MSKFVFEFEEGNKDLRELLGGKGADLSEMTKIGLPVPKGFVISTQACHDYYINNKILSKSLIEEIENALQQLEKKTGKQFGSKTNPLLVSVRSGAPVSMPGMMDTILNLGLNDETVKVLAQNSGNESFAFNSYRRLIQMFGDVVLEIEHSLFDKIIEAQREKRKVKLDTELKAEDWKEICQKFLDLVEKESKNPFPSDPKKQLELSLKAVFSSWNNPRAISYRRINNIPEHWGTAVNVQEMVFGNRGLDSASGVAFTRNPSTGENKLYGEYLINSQGEDVVAGIRTPKQITELKKDFPKIFEEFNSICKKLEQHYKEMEDLEFTIEKGKLFILQTRTGKRTAPAAVKIAVEMMEEGRISKETAVLRVEPEQIEQLLHKRINPKAKQNAKLLAKGLPASPGAAVGKVVFNSEQAFELKQNFNEEVVLVRTETSPEDIEGMNAAIGILTSRGGMTSHAAVVARGMGKCCVAGCDAVKVNEKSSQFVCGNEIVKENDWISLDGSTGEVFLGKLEVIEAEMSSEFKKLMNWADYFRTLKVRANADTEKDALVARGFGAEGIGLCRTEHMFFEEERIMVVREMMLAENVEGRKKALEKILPMQQKDFEKIFTAMNGLPVTIRFLDPPLHEFLPKEEKELIALSKSLNVSAEKLRQLVDSLHEFNPMLGHRGVRLGITFPEIFEMQCKAIFLAALNVSEKNIKVFPELEIPLVGLLGEFTQMKELIKGIAKELKVEGKINYKIGTMIELPRACIRAEAIAREAEFFSFGTNDLTQTTLGLSRDDAGKFLAEYISKGIFSNDPFAVLDQKGVGALMQLCIAGAKKSNPKIEIGICGEHGGEPSSVEFCHKIGLNYVSCSPYRVPVARLAAAHAALKNGKK